MKASQIAIIAVLGFLGYQALRVLSAVNTVQLVFNGIQPQSALSYNLNFLIQNVTNVTANLNAITGAVYVNGTMVGTLTNFTPVAIPATSQVSINVNLQVSVLGALSQAVSLIQSGADDGVTIEVKGNMNVDSLVIPFDETLAQTAVSA
jgi:Late embryogenesis abundant protein